MIGNDAFQEADTVGITRPCTKHNYLVKDAGRPARVSCTRRSTSPARAGPGRWWSTCPRTSRWARRRTRPRTRRAPQLLQPGARAGERQDRAGDRDAGRAERPLFYVGGGVINAGAAGLRAAGRARPRDRRADHLTLMGLGAFPARDPQFARHGRHARDLRGQHGDARLRSDGRDRRPLRRPGDRAARRLRAATRKKIHVDIDPSSINKNVPRRRADRRRRRAGARGHARRWRRRSNTSDRDRLEPWWAQIDEWPSGQPALPPDRQGDQAAVRDPAALRADRGSRRLHHDRGRPAPDVGGPALQVREAASTG